MQWYLDLQHATMVLSVTASQESYRGPMRATESQVAVQLRAGNEDADENVFELRIGVVAVTQEQRQTVLTDFGTSSGLARVCCCP